MTNIENKNDPKKIVAQYLQIAIGAAIMALGVYLFFVPHSIVVGGVSGLGIIILHYSSNYWPFAIPVWLTNVAINIPLVLIALKILGIKFLVKTIFAFSSFSLAMFLLEEFVQFSLATDFFLASVIGGVVTGIGLGLVYRHLATTGGSVLIATLIHKFLKHVPPTRILMFVDWSIILMGFFVFGEERTMYAIIAIFISTKAMEYVLEGLNFAKAAFIISEQPEKLEQTLIQQMGRGLTTLDGRGGFTGAKKDVLLCVVSKREIAKLKEIVTSVDKKAFVIVADVREVLGEGFKEFDSKI